MSPPGYQETISNEAPSCLRGGHYHYRLNPLLTLQLLLLERTTNGRGVGGAASGVAAQHHHRRQQQQNEEAGAGGGLPPPPAALFLDHEDTRHRVPLRLTNNNLLNNSIAVLCSRPLNKPVSIPTTSWTTRKQSKAPGLSRQQVVEIIESALDLIGDEDEFL